MENFGKKKKEYVYVKTLAELVKSDQMSPMMRQYVGIKKYHMDCILFFRVGDFYEMFFEDATIGSEVLDISLTKKDCGFVKKAPLCGVPYHSYEAHAGKLLRKGYKVAICEQMEPSKKGTDLVRREVVRIITPGTLTEFSMLEDSKNNFLCIIYKDDEGAGLTFVDISTGDFNVTSLGKDNLIMNIINEIAKFLPAEIIINSSEYNNLEFYKEIKGRFLSYVEPYDQSGISFEKCESLILSKFQKSSLDEINIK